MKKWEIESVIAPDLIGVTTVREEEEKKLYALLEKGFEHLPYYPVEYGSD